MTSLLEACFLGFAIVVFCGVATFGTWNYAGSADASSNPMNTVCNSIILVGISGMLLLRWRQAVEMLPHALPLLIFIVMASASVFWSTVPGVSGRHVGSLLVTIFVPLYMAVRYAPNDSIKILGRALLLVCVVSALVAIFIPSLGTESVSSQGLDSANLGDWKGLFPVKNNLGWVIFGAVQVYGWRFTIEPKKRWYHGAVILFLILVVTKVHSATALVSIIVSLSLLVVLRVRRLGGAKQFAIESVLLLIFIMIAVLLPLWFTTLVEMLGKDVTLTGRIPLWQAAYQMALHRPWLGYGYYGFWVDQNPAYHWVVDQIHWAAPDAHNAYMELLLEVGFIGAVVGTLPLIVVVVRSWRLCADATLSWPIYASMFSIVFALTNLVDTRLLRSGDIYCFVLALCYFMLIRHTLEEQIGRVKPKLRRAAWLRPGAPDGTAELPAVTGGG